MNAAEWNAKYPPGTHVIVNPETVKRIKEGPYGGDLGLSADGRSKTGLLGPDMGSAFETEEYGARVAVDGVCGCIPLESVTPCGPPSPEYVAEMAKREAVATLANDLAAHARAGRWDDVTLCAGLIGVALAPPFVVDLP